MSRLMSRSRAEGGPDCMSRQTLDSSSSFKHVLVSGLSDRTLLGLCPLSALPVRAGGHRRHLLLLLRGTLLPFRVSRHSRGHCGAQLWFLIASCRLLCPVLYLCVGSFARI